MTELTQEELSYLAEVCKDTAEPAADWISAEEAAPILHLTPYNVRMSMKHGTLDVGLYTPYPNKRGGRYRISAKKCHELAKEWGFE